MNIFLDLEETVIDDWESCIFLYKNILFIKNTISELSLKFNNGDNSNISLILFSMAVVNSNDVEKFNIQIKPILEKELGMSFDDIFLFDEDTWRNLVIKEGIMPLFDDTIHELFKFNPKEEIFNLIAKKGETNILFDDTVQDKYTCVYEDKIFGNILTDLVCIKV